MVQHRRQGLERNVFARRYEAFSRITAIPWPPPMHAAPTAYLRFFVLEETQGLLVEPLVHDESAHA